MSNTELKPITKDSSIKDIINSPAMQEQFAAALPKHLSPERFARIAITALTRTPKLKDCTKESLFKCLLDLSAMGLEPDGRRAYLIPYENRRLGVTECQLQIDYKGLVELVRRSGDVVKIHADIVCENDTFEHGMGEIKEHTYDLKADRGEPYAAYAQVTLKDGSVQCEIMSKADIEKIRAKSKAAQGDPWKDHWGEMAKKTVFRRLTKWLTLSPEIMENIHKVDEYEFRPMRTVNHHHTPLAAPINPFEKPSFEAIEAPTETQTEDEKW